MWDLRNRSVVALVSVLSGCVFLYNVWGPFFIITISLFLTIYACYSLITNDSLLSPHAFLLFDYCKHISVEVCTSIKGIVNYVYEYIRQFWKIVNRRFLERHLTQFRMERRRGTHYQLSNDCYPMRRNSSNFGLIAQLSPISKDAQKTDSTNDISSKNKFYHNSGHSSYNHSPLGKHTLMPMFPRNKEDLENHTVELISPNQTLPKKASPTYRQNHALTSEDTMYLSREGSSWDTSASPKINENPSKLKGFQAVARPLLSSTRYNIDQRVYNDITSPGLTSRLTKYAAEANNKLTHQSQYRVGQFPKVNLHASPVPLINAKSVRPKTPVTVRVAPPHTIRYSPPSKQEIFSNLRHSDNSCSSPSVTQALREISLKRHASNEDVAFDLAKKQRTEDVINKEFEPQDETKQKRSREESLKAEDDTSPLSKGDRPTKRTKTPSCYDILNSFSSSKHVVSGVKRKARDFSRSGTPDFEKHFKSLECIQNNSLHPLSQIQNASPKYDSQEVTEKRNSSVSTSSDKVQEQSPLRGILKTVNKSPEIKSNSKDIYTKHLDSYGKKNHSQEPVTSTDTVKLTHKLFMRAEPERNEKLRMLVEEQGSIRAKFTTDDVEEIKKEDIADMRQTSMKARLQSMFDAISGKGSSQINPDVVIQAEEVNAIKSVECPVTCATLNSSTTTTNVNTTPISTSAVAPSLSTNESTVKPSKHVAFNLPNKEVSSNANAQNSNTFEVQTKHISSPTVDKTRNASENMFTTKSAVASHPPVSSGNIVNSNSTVQNFGFNKPLSSTVASTLSGTVFTSNAVSSSKSVPSFVPSTTTSLFGNVENNIPTSLPISKTSTTLNAKTETSQNYPTNVSQIAQHVSSNSNAPLGSDNMIIQSTGTNFLPTVTMVVTQNKVQNVGSSSVTSNMNTIPLHSGTSTISTGPTMGTFTSTSTSLFTFGNQSSNLQTSNAEVFSFSSPANTQSISQGTSTFGSLTKSHQTQSMSTTTTTNAAISTTTNTSMNSTASQSNSVSTATTSSVTHNSNIKTTAPSFTSPATSAFSFRAPNPTESVNKPGFSFGSAPSTTKISAESSNTPAFTTGNNNALPSFGSLPAAASVSQFNSIFGNASAPSVFATTTTSQSIFSTPSTVNTTSAIFTTPKSSITPIFGANVATTTVGFTGTSSSSVFSNTTSSSSSAGTNTTSVPIFGSAPSVTGISGSLFSGSSSTAPPSTFGTASNIFGQGTSSNADFKNTSGMFGSNSGAPNMFGSQATTTSTFGTTNAVTTSSNNVPIFGSVNSSNNSAVPTFGPTTTTTPTFGSQNTTHPTSPTTTAPTFGIGTSIFGSNSGTASAGFGTNISSPFNSSISNTFGGQNTPSSNAFGTTSSANTNTNANTTSNTNVSANINANANSVAMFGDNKVLPFGTQTPAFGSSSVSNTAFGTTNNPGNENSNTGGIFTFGTNQNPPQQSTFSFGNNNNVNSNATTSTSAPFQFSGASSNPATGFNFSAPTTTPSINFGTTSAPQFNASTPGMFSIGSGFTAPRSRNVRGRKPR